MLRLLVALAVVNAMLAGPAWLRPDVAVPSLLALEAVLLVGAFALLPRRRWSGVLSWAAAVGLVALGLLGLGDAGFRMALDRPLNLYLDLHLLGSVHDLLAGAVGAVAAGALLAGGAIAALAAAAGIARLLGEVRARDGEGHLRAGVLALVVSSAAVASGFVLRGEPEESRGRRIGTPAADLAVAQARRLGRMLQARERFGAELAAAPESAPERNRALRRLRDRDVVVAFVESYGTSALRDPRYARVLRPRLEEMHERLAGAGLHLATGSLVAPTQGGESWFSHASLLSGLWLDDQLRYDLLVASDRRTLVDDFADAGHRTVAVMPAITRAWPEGERFGYDRIYARDDIDYRGPALNWVTMPDQFTWWFLERRIRRTDDPRPVFAEVGLISSHAPWTPILPVLEDWHRIGDGTVFAPWADAGEPPEELWRDPSRVRRHYALALDYAIHAATAWAERFVDEETLLVVLGDHQPAPLITGEGADRTVPVHVISGDRALVEPFVDWGFALGPFPDPEVPAPGMDAFRGWFLRAYAGRDRPEE